MLQRCLVAVAFAMGAMSSAKACSPWSPLTYTWEVVGNQLRIQLNSHTGWQCCYTGRVELRCVAQAFTGSFTHSTNQICKGAGGNTNTYPTTAFPFQLLVIDLSPYCPGSSLKWRARENGPDGNGPLTPEFVFTVPGSYVPLTVQATANPVEVCPTECSTLSASAVGGCGTLSYSWSPGGTGATTSVCPGSATTYTVTASANNQCGAIQTETATVTVDMLPVPVAGLASLEPAELCEGETTLLTLTGYSGAIQWQTATSDTGPWADIPGATLPTHGSGPISSTVFYRAAVSTVCPVVFSNVVSVQLAPLPPLAFTSTTACEDGPTQFTDETVQSAPITSWAWDFGDGAGSTVQDPVHQYPAAGTYTAGLTVTFANGCVSDLEQQVTVMPVPIADFSTTLVCSNVNTPFLDLSTVTAPYTITAWDWDIGNNGTVDHTTQAPTHLFGDGGTYPVSLTVTSNTGCVGSVVLPVAVTPAPTAAFTTGNVCRDFTSSFTDASLGQPVLFDWDFGDGNNSSEQDPEHVYAASGTYDVTLTVTNAENCPSTITLPVTVWPRPEASFTSTDPVSCSPLCIDLTSTSTTLGGGIVGTFWSFGDGSVSQDVGLSRCFENDDLYDDIALDLELIVVNAEGCRDTLFQDDYLVVNHNPVANFLVWPRITNMFDRRVNLLNQSTGEDEILWDLGDLNTSTEQEFQHTYADTGTYIVTLTVTTVNGCVDEISTEVIVLPVINFSVPNAFTPDGDGLNETFFFGGFGILEKDFEFLVFNRWGEVVYETSAFVPWDGTVGGIPAPDGVYAYHIRYRDTLGGAHVKLGHVTLLR
jgi:gliding motility-associated-like protein